VPGQAMELLRHYGLSLYCRAFTVDVLRVYPSLGRFLLATILASLLLANDGTTQRSHARF
jgi:hypothetical protein